MNAWGDKQANAFVRVPSKVRTFSSDTPERFENPRCGVGPTLIDTWEMGGEGTLQSLPNKRGALPHLGSILHADDVDEGRPTQTEVLENTNRCAVLSGHC